MADMCTYQGHGGDGAQSKVAAGGSFPSGNIKTGSKQNYLAFWGNKQTMNLNHLIYENIMISPYYNKTLANLKTYHEVLDEIYQHVDHLEPWERGTRKTTGQTGMCGGVRGVGAGGVVSSAFCILYKLFTLKLTRKQLISMLNRTDSCYIRGIGFMYIRFCLHPKSFWYWFQPYLDDDEEIDPKSGGGDVITIGAMLKQMLTKLEWYSTLFPRIPVPIQKDIANKLQEVIRTQKAESYAESATADWGQTSANYGAEGWHEEALQSRNSSEEYVRRKPRGSPDVKRRARSRSSSSRRSRERSLPRGYGSRRSRSRSRRRHRWYADRRRSRSYDRHRRRSLRSPNREHRHKDKRHRLSSPIGNRHGRDSVEHIRHCSPVKSARDDRAGGDVAEKHSGSEVEEGLVESDRD